MGGGGPHTHDCIYTCPDVYIYIYTYCIYTRMYTHIYTSKSYSLCVYVRGKYSGRRRHRRRRVMNEQQRQKNDEK